MARINSNGFTAVWAGVSADTASPGAIEQLLADNADHLSYKVVRGSDGTVTITAQMNKEKGTKYNCNASNFTFGGVQPDVETGKRRGDSAATYRDHAHWLLQLPDKNAIHQNTNYVIKLKDVKLKWADEAWDQKLLTDEWYLNLVRVVARSSYDLRVRRVQAYWSRVAAEQDEADMIERVENDSPLQPFNAEAEALAGEFLKQFEKPSARHTYLILVGGNGVGKSTFAEAGVGALMVARGLATESRPFVHNGRINWEHNSVGQGEPYNHRVHTHVIFNDVMHSREPLLLHYVPNHRVLFRSTPHRVPVEGIKVPLFLAGKPIIHTINKDHYEEIADADDKLINETVAFDTFGVIRVLKPLTQLGDHGVVEVLSGFNLGKKRLTLRLKKPWPAMSDTNDSGVVRSTDDGSSSSDNEDEASEHSSSSEASERPANKRRRVE